MKTLDLINIVSTPKYVNLKCKTNSIASQKAIKIARTTWIKNEIKSLYKKDFIT